MASIVLFHSVLGLRPTELSAAALFEARGHTVRAPDLFGGHTAVNSEDGFAVMDKVGWHVICNRARAALDGMPQTSVLVGFSMGAGVISTLWPERPRAAGVLLLHGLADIPATANPSTPVQAHVADPDPFIPPRQLRAWERHVSDGAFNMELFHYPGAAHFFTDSSLDDFDGEAADLAWDRALAFLKTLGTSSGER